MCQLEHTTKSEPQHGGFSLIELLVVISIIAILIALLLPALGQARLQGEKLSELSASRTLSQGYAVYAYDHKNNLLPAHVEDYGDWTADSYGTPFNPTEVPKRWAWRLVLHMNTTPFGSLLVNERADALAEYTGTGWAYNVSIYPSFGLNQANLGGRLDINGNLEPGALDGLIRNIDQAVDPSRMVVFSSAGSTGPPTNPVIQGWYNLSAPTIPYAYSATGWSTNDYTDENTPPDAWGWVHARYGLRAIVGHLDGHAEAISIEDLRDMTRWNNQAARQYDPDWTP